MYLIDITIKADKVPADKAEKLLDGHRAWFKEQFDNGNFLVVGPYQDRQMAGLVLAQAESRAVLDAIISRDAYYADQLATYDVSEFKANLIADNITDYRGK